MNDLIKNINRHINRNMTWTEDSEVYGRQDYWATYNQIKKRFGDGQALGDCDDYASQKYHLLKESGIEISKLYMVVCMNHSNNTSHMVLAYYEDGENPWILDNQTDIIFKASELRDYQPIMAFNEKEVKCF